MDDDMYKDIRDLLDDGLADMGIEDYGDALIIVRQQGETEYRMYYETENIGGLIGMMEIAKADLINDIISEE